MFNTIKNNQTNACNQPKYNARLKNNILSGCMKNFIRHSQVFAVIAVAVLTVIMANAVTTKAANGCSKALDNPLGFHFKDICNQHDARYGTPWNTYRGYTYQSWKEFADEEFYESLKNRCDQNYSAWYDKARNFSCKAIARSYYEAIQTPWGNQAYYNAQRNNQRQETNAQYPNYILYNGRYWTQYQGKWFYSNGKNWVASQ